MAEYPHDRDWEISPEERSKQRRRKHLRPPEPEPEHPDARGDGQPKPTSDPGPRPRNRPPLQQRTQRQDDGEDQPGLLYQVLYEIFAPIIGFVGFSMMTLTWTAFLTAALLAYKPADALSMSTIGLGVLIWIIGMGTFKRVLVAIGQSQSR